MTDLFTWRRDRAPCAVVPFPQAKRIGRAREVALNAFAMASDRKRDAYRRTIHYDLVRLLMCRGIDQSEAESQVAAFDLIVDREVERLRTMDRLGLLNERGGVA